jgi:hypothetical protein
MNRVLFCALLALCLTACTTPSGSQRPDFSGRYLLDRINSKLEAIDISSLQSATIVIEHREPVFKFQRTFTMGGRDQTFSYDLTGDGNEVKAQSAGQDQYSRLYWEGDTLVFAMRIVSAAGESTDTVHYRLTNGGHQLEAEEAFRGPGGNYDNHWVFTRQ